MENEDSQNIGAYKKRDAPRMLNIKGIDIYNKDPPLKMIFSFIGVENQTVNII